MLNIKLILFDLDDTLIHFDDYWKDSLMETFRQHSATKNFDSATLFNVLLEYNDKYEALYHRQEITLDQFRNYRLMRTLEDFGQTINEEIAHDFNQLHRVLSREYMRSSPSLIQLLTELKRSYELGIVTNGTTDWQQDKIEAMGIRPLFAPGAIIISEEVGFEKPAPEIYLKALSFFDIAPENALFVGDSWSNDVEGPGQVGISTVWLNRKGAVVPDHQPNLLGIISKLSELKQFSVKMIF